MHRVRPFFLVSAAVLAGSALAVHQGVLQLQHDGKTVSTNLRTVDGVLMVPVRDVASYLGGELTVQNDTATITGSKANVLGVAPPYLSGNTTTGAAEPLISTMPTRPAPIERTVGVGQDADNDGFVLRVLSFDEPKGSYRTEYDSRKKRIGPVLPEDRLVVVKMRLENRTSETRVPTLPSSQGLTLFDEKGVGVPIVAFDARPVGNPQLIADLAPMDLVDAPVLAPGGAFEFAAVFSVPKDRTPSYVLAALPAAATDRGGTNVRVNLK
jgi:hypothetical protein